MKFNKISADFDIRESKNQTYNEMKDDELVPTSEHILYLRFDEQVEVGDCESDFAVLSLAVSRNLRKCGDDADKVFKFLDTCDIVDNDGQLAVKMPDSTKVLFSRKRS